MQHKMIDREQPLCSCFDCFAALDVRLLCCNTCGPLKKWIFAVPSYLLNFHLIGDRFKRSSLGLYSGGFPLFFVPHLWLLWNTFYFVQFVLGYFTDVTFRIKQSIF